MSAKDVKITVLSRKTEWGIDVKKKKENLVPKELQRCSDEYCVLLNRKKKISVLDSKKLILLVNRVDPLLISKYGAWILG